MVVGVSGGGRRITLQQRDSAAVFFVILANIANHRFGTRQELAIGESLFHCCEHLLPLFFFAGNSSSAHRLLFCPASTVLRARDKKGKEKKQRKKKKNNTHQDPVTDSILTTVLRGHRTGPFSIY